MKLAIVLGTRPEIIKMAPLIHEAQDRGLDFVIIHSGQHYDPEMDGIFFREMGLPAPDLRLQSGGKPYADQFAHLLSGLEKAFIDFGIDTIVLQGDTVAVMAGALAGRKIGAYIVHHEGGLRSRNPHMAEEYHRIIADHLSDLICAPTALAMKNILTEGIDPARLELTGNTIVDAVREAVGCDAGRTVESLGLSDKGYVLATFHRAENVDDRHRLASGFDALARVATAHPSLRCILSAHPRLVAKRRSHDIAWPERFEIIDPVGYFGMLSLVKSARLVLTDSGGLQEECAILGVPCVTLRETTERPETVEAGLNIVAGLDPDAVADAALTMMGKEMHSIDAFGDGYAARKIIDAILKRRKGFL